VNVLAVDIGGTHVKILASGRKDPRRFVSGPKLTPKEMAVGVKKLAQGWKYDAISIGYPGMVVHHHPVVEPRNLGRGWVGFGYRAAFGKPVKIVNDAAMQALGSYKGGKMLFLGLGTGLGSTMIADGIVEPMELAHLPYRKGTYEDYVGLRGLEKRGKKKWRQHVEKVVAQLTAALEPDEIVLGAATSRSSRNCPQNAGRATMPTPSPAGSGSGRTRRGRHDDHSHRASDLATGLESPRGAP